MKEGLEAIGRLAAGIAHEINTPTQYVGDNIRFLQEAFEDLMAGEDIDDLADEIPAAIEQSLEGIERIAKIVQAMKAFSHPGVEEKTQADLNRLVESTVTVSTNEWKYVADVHTALDDDLPLVWCVPGKLNQVLLNLIVNAVHAIADRGEARGEIDICTMVEGDGVVVSVRDTGCGIPADAQARVFEPFFTTKAVGRGTGQGLSIAAGVVRDHGGTIDFETSAGGGTTFFVRLPVGQPAQAAA